MATHSNTGEKIKNLLCGLLLISGLSLSNSSQAYAHCQIPCGIYNDHARVQQMLEDVATVEKLQVYYPEHEH
ncbi:MAG: nickel superoxide dismutase [Candidatus Krumholzibacteriia bacterium]|jgi:nickel superoxide dismutase